MSLPEAWRHALGTVELFSGLDEGALVHLGAALEEKSLPRGTYLVRQGDAGDSLFVVLAGRLEVLLDRTLEGKGGEIVLHALAPGSVVGEMALVLGGRRTASVRALEDTRVLELSRKNLDQLRERYPEILLPFTRLLHERIRRVSIAGHLKDLFGELEEAALREIEGEVTWVHLASGQVLFRQGDPVDGAYIVVAGRVRVAVGGMHREDGGERAIDEAGPGQWIGEMGLLTRRPRSATVYAVRDTDLVLLSQATFTRLIERSPRALLETSRLLVARLERQMGGATTPRTHTNTLAIVPTGPDVPIDEFTTQLVDVLRGYGSVLRLTAAEVDKRLGRPGIAAVPSDDPGHMRLAPWLMEQESAHRFVVYQADTKWSEWTDRALRHADRVLLVANGDGQPAVTECETRVAMRFEGGRAPKQYLVLLHPPDKKVFENTARWLGPRRVEGHFHVGRGVGADVARLTRLLIGNAVCLVLGGGGARGFAHVGVLRAFEELGIPIDAIGGTSIGAFLGGSFAMGYTHEQLLSVCGPMLTKMVRPTVPTVSLLSARKAIAAASQIAGTLDLEDTKTPFFCVSTNLTRGGEVIHTRGSAAVAVRASTAVPGIWPPVPWGTDFLVDGGLTDNVPVGPMATLFGGLIVAVDVIPEVDLVAPPARSAREKRFRDRFDFLADQRGLPNIFNNLMRSVATAGNSLRRGVASNAASLYLRPAVNQWNLLDFGAARPIADQGYRGTVRELEAWWKANSLTVLGSRPRA